MATNTAKTIECTVQPLGMSFHPNRELAAVALVDGTIEVHDYSVRTTVATSRHSDDNDEMEEEEEEDTILSSIPVHSSESPVCCSKKNALAKQGPSSRCVLFSNQGSHLFTAGNGGVICCLDTVKSCDTASLLATTNHNGSLLWKVQKASPSGISRLYQLPENAVAGQLLVSGDDEGTIRLWDTRLCTGSTNTGSNSPFDGLMNETPTGCVMTYKFNSDYISGFDMDNNSDGSTLLASCADGTLSVFDIRRSSVTNNKNASKLIRQSDDQDDELLSVAIMKRGKKVVCGTQRGVLAVWSWGTWGDISDRFPGHPQSIDALLKLDEDTVLTGSSDGLVRLVQIQPDRLLAVLGNHDNFPIEALQFTTEKRFVASLGHDPFIRLWDTSILTDDDDDDDDDENEKMKHDEVTGKEMKDNNVKQNGPSSQVAVSTWNSSIRADGEDDWKDMDESNSSGSSDDDNDDDDDCNDRRKKHGKKFKTEAELFFKDL